jgi:hypothetical protein
MMSESMGTTLTFPPQSNQGEQIALLVDVLATACPAGATWYLSTPITTGSRFQDWVRRTELDESHPEYRNEHKANVIVPNVAAAERVVSDLRSKGSVVVSPAALGDMPGWTQADYLVFWSTVIRTFVHTVVFMDGWQHSRGCIFEFLVALEAGLETLRQDLTPMMREEGAILIRKGSSEIADDSPDSFVEAILDRLVHAKSGTG